MTDLTDHHTVTPRKDNHMTTITDPDASIKAAANACAATRRLVTTLENRVANGDTDITASQIAQARDEAEFAKLRYDATLKAAEQARVASRLAACEALRDEIQSSAITTGPALAELLRDADAALRAFMTAVDQRNAQIAEWRHRLLALGVPTTNATMPPPEHGNLGTTYEGTDIIAGNRRVDIIDGNHWIALLTSRIRPRDGARSRYITDPPGGYSIDDLFAAIAAIDPDQSQPS